MNSILVDLEPVEIIILKRKRKSLEIQIKSGSLVRVLVPERLALKKINTILSDKMEWIEEKIRARRVLEALIEKEGPATPKLDAVMVLGIYRQVSFHPRESSDRRKTPEIILEPKALIIKAVNEPTLEEKGAMIEQYLRQLCKEKVDRLVPFYAQILGVEVNRILVKDQKRRWGSCSSLKNLNFNWRCAMMPEWILNYIVIHEVCHLVHMNHSQAFWDLVSTLEPRYDEARIWLRKNASHLNINH